MRTPAWIIGLGLICALPCGVNAAGEYDAGTITWSRLEFQVTKLGITATSEISLRTGSVAEIGSDLRPIPDGGELQPRRSQVAVLTLESQALWRSSTLDLWFDPTDAAALQRVQLETGKAARRNRYRLLRFTGHSAYSLTRKATEDEVGKPHEEWSQVNEWTIDYPRRVPRGVTTPSALFYILSAGNLSQPGDTLQLYLFSKSRLMELDLEVLGRAEIDSDYVQIVAGEESALQETVSTIEISLDGRPVDGGEGEESFEFLGLRGDVRIYLEPRLRIPVQVSGAIKVVGPGDVKLKRVVRR